MTKQLTNISEAFDQMIEDAQHNQSKIKQRKTNSSNIIIKYY